MTDEQKLINECLSGQPYSGGHEAMMRDLMYRQMRLFAAILEKMPDKVPPVSAAVAPVRPGLGEPVWGTDPSLADPDA